MKKIITKMLLLLMSVCLSLLLSGCYSTIPITYPTKIHAEKCRLDSFPVTISLDASKAYGHADGFVAKKAILTIKNNTDNFISIERIQFLPSGFIETTREKEILLSPHQSIIEEVGVINGNADNLVQEVQLTIRLSDNSFNSCSFKIDYNTSKEKVYNYSKTYLASLGWIVGISAILGILAAL